MPLIASILVAVLLAAYIATVVLLKPSGEGGAAVVVGEEVLLPLPKKTTSVTVEEAILLRRSIRDYTRDPITIEQLSMVLWAAQGITDARRRFRAAPSAGATYPLEIYVVVGEKGVVLENNSYLKPGVYKYNVYRHSLVLVKEGDYREELSKAALNQRWVREAPVNIVICAVYERTTSRYGERGIRYVHIEVGHVGQNIYLMATALGLGTVAVGAFYDDQVARIIGAKPEEHPLYIMPIGVPAKPYKTSFEEINNF
ncbi:MAG TPA: SagB/ThcOx family dehydrogenase, partial [Pyrodictium sp.]|nr:SagB/ThcOx family dehydrogenase [Pyrodictium sp.]